MPPFTSDRRQWANEVFPQVVDHRVGAERPHELEVLRVAHRGDVGAEVLAELHRGGADRAGGAVDEEPLPAADVSQSQAVQGEDRAVANGRRLLERDVARHLRQRGPLPDADELGMCAVPTDIGAEDAVTDRELADGRADGFNLSGQPLAGDPPLWSAEAR